MIVGIDGIVNMGIISIDARFVVEVKYVPTKNLKLCVENAPQILFVLMVNGELYVLNVLVGVYVIMVSRDIYVKHVRHYSIYILVYKQKQ